MSSILIKPLSQIKNNTIYIPGSKSYTNRALLLSALTKGTVELKNPLWSDDTKAMINCLNTLGIKVKKRKNSLYVIGSIDDVSNSTYKLNAHLSGTTIRFILALCCIIPGVKVLEGEQRLNERPTKELVQALKDLGAKIEYLKSSGFPPLKISSSKLNPGIISIKGDVSSQYFSALLMIIPTLGQVTINVLNKQISKPYIDMTIDTIKKFGVAVKNNHYKQYAVKLTQKYSLKKYVVEGDYSSAGYFFAIAALTKNKITIKNLNTNSVQADKKLLEILQKMGSKISFKTNSVTIQGNGVKPLSINMEDCPDQIQTIAILASFAQGVTKINGISSLRVKETDRVQALKNELRKMKIKTLATKNVLTIYGGSPKPTAIDTYNDHRMAMSFAVAGTKLEGIIINNPEVTSKTFPDFWDKLKNLGVEIKKI